MTICSPPGSLFLFPLLPQLYLWALHQDNIITIISLEGVAEEIVIPIILPIAVTPSMIINEVVLVEFVGTTDHHHKITGILCPSQKITTIIRKFHRTTTSSNHSDKKLLIEQVDSCYSFVLLFICKF
jgi:hypothetical protein